MSHADLVVTKTMSGDSNDSQFFHIIADAFPGMVFVISSDGKCSFVNESFRTFTGRKVEDLLARSWTETVHPDDCTRAQFAQDQVMRAGSADVAAYRFLRHDGRWRSIEMRLLPVRAQDGRIVACIALCTAVDERHVSVSDVEEREGRLKEAQRLGGIGSWEWYRETDASPGSEELYRIFGLDPSMPFPNFAVQRGVLYPPEDYDRLAAAVDKTLHTGRGYELELRAFRSGKPIWIVTRGEAVRDQEGRITGLRGTVQDITEHRRAQQSLHESEERLRLATSLAEVGFWDVDLVNDTLVWPASVKAMFGISPDKPVSMADFYAGLHPEHREETTAAFLAACDPVQRALYDVEYRTIGKEDGIVRWVAAKGRGIFDEQGRCVRVLGTAIDISERKRSEEALRDSEARLRVVTENARVGLVVVGKDHRYRFANQAYADILGLPSADITGLRVADLLSAVYEEQIRPRLDRAFSGEAVAYELVVPPHDEASERLYAVTYQPSRKTDDEPVVIVVIYDVTERERTKQEAERSRRLLEAFVETVPGVVYAKDREGRLMVANRGTSELLGKSPEAYLGKTDAEILEDRFQAERVMANDRRIMENGEAEQLEEEVRFPDGTNAVWLSTKVPLRNEAGEIVGIVGSSIDITARKQAEAAVRESEAAMRMFADAMPTLAWIAKADGWIFWYNRRWYEYTGSVTTDMEGWGWESVHDPAVLPAVKQRWMTSIENGTPFEMTFPLKGADGIFRPFLTRVVPMRDGEGRILRWFGTNTDVSPERAIQAKLEASEAALREADRRKDEFLATLSHELRNPLAPVLTASTLLTSANLPPEKAAWASQIIQRQIQHMAWLLDDLLDVARITQGKLELKREMVSLTNVVDTAVEAARPLLDRKHHELSIDLPTQPVMLHVDPLRLSQVMSNLLTNAAKYTDPAGKIRLAADVGGDELVVTVRDNGIGLPAGATEKIFVMFSQVREGTGRSEGGLGIGLALCKGLVELHGGRIEALSDGPGKGSEFVVRVPIGVAAFNSETTSTDRNDDDRPPKLRVMVVDDNQDAADTLGAVLGFEGHDVRVAYGGRAAVALAGAFRPDVAVLDIGMPDMDGNAVARALRKEPWADNLRLIALTGWGQEEDKRETADAGFDAHITKPVDSKHLAELLIQPRELLQSAGGGN